MFSKPLSNLKTSAPLRSSDRRKLRQRVITAYEVTAEEGDSLVPEGILSIKFITRSEEPGVAYIDKAGDPLWFTLGKGSDDLIPTVYTLWKKRDLLPFLSTPSAVIPILIGGADLMIPGVVHCPSGLPEGQLVAIRQYSRKNGEPELSPPVAVGRMALPSSAVLSHATEKGKAVHVLHTWKDHLWDMGSKKDLPEGIPTAGTTAGSTDDDDSETEDVEKEGAEKEDDATPPPPSPPPETLDAGPIVTYTPAEVSELLHKSLLQAIFTTLKSLPPSAFPIPATLLYTNHILPSRPAFPTLVLPPSADIPPNDSSDYPRVDTEITIKTSSHKSLSTFLKAAEKLSLLTLKPPQKQQPDILVTSVNGSHPSVVNHTPFVMVKDLEQRAAQKAAREEKQRENEAKKEIEITELWKPHQTTVDLFKALTGNENKLHPMGEIRALLNSYITEHNLVNPRDQAYINLDDTLYSCIYVKSKGKNNAEPETEPPRFMKRDDLTKAIVGKMQDWYEVRADGRDPVTKKGKLTPIQVVAKVRQGRKTSTLISGFEPFLVVDAEEMADDLRKSCAGATSVSQVQGKPGGPRLEVLVQGNQISAVLQYLLGKGIPKKWIESVGAVKGKK